MASSRITNALLWGTIGTNVAVFARWRIYTPKPGQDDREAEIQHIKYMHDNYTISCRNMEQGRWWTLLTSSFSHNSPMHLLFNMILINQAAKLGTVIGLGPLRLGTLAVGSALSGSIGCLYSNNRQIKNGEPELPVLGASSIVQGLLVATMLAAPRLPVNLFFIPIDLSYRNVVLGFIGWDLYHMYQERQKGKPQEAWWLGSNTYVAYAGHLGGAAFGAVFYMLAMRRGVRMPRIR